MPEFDDVDSGRGEFFAWCFSHGRLHRFTHPGGPWCTADWVQLDGVTEAEAMTEKQAAWGDAQFLDHLSIEKQAAALGLTDEEEG